jgi:hypothetical protein
MDVHPKSVETPNNAFNKETNRDLSLLDIPNGGHTEGCHPESRLSAQIVSPREKSPVFRGGQKNRWPKTEPEETKTKKTDQRIG